ncbi:MAG: hypothetical protein IJ123_09830 [Blautia sp.]|nr:hypothetical protein [Blautia sp.]
MNRSLRYSILDPSGNITILVETPVDILQQPAVASRLMKLHPEAEQTGFVNFQGRADCSESSTSLRMPGEGSCASLRMAGGEFCGNASMCAAVLYSLNAVLKPAAQPESFVSDDGFSAASYELISSQVETPEPMRETASGSLHEMMSEMMCEENSSEISLTVSGALRPVRVRMSRKPFFPGSDKEIIQRNTLNSDDWYTAICMPEPKQIAEMLFKAPGMSGTDTEAGISGAGTEPGISDAGTEPGISDAGINVSISGAGNSGCEMCSTLPVVELEGISHIIIEPDSAFVNLLSDRKAAEAAVKNWCLSLGADGLGLMFLSGDLPEVQLTPLVYIPGSDTIFWENSCASGTSAAAMYLASKAGSAIYAAFHEPGGILRVQSDPAAMETWLYGRVRLIGKFEYDL